MGTVFEPTTSIRAPFASAAAPSMADSLPSINFGFEELRDRMAKFTVKFDTFIEAGRKRVLEERNSFRMNVAELKEDESSTRKRIELLTSQSKSHSQTLSREAAETSEITSQIASLTTQRDAQLSLKASLESRISTAQKQIESKISAQAAHAKALQSQTRHDIPELDFWVQNLGLRIEKGKGEDRILFVYTMVDEGDLSKEAWFELDCSNREYSVRKSGPKVEAEKVQRLVEVLNEKRELGPILRGMRELFVEYYKAERA